MFKPLACWKLNRIANGLADRISSEAWRHVVQLGEKSEKMAETLKETREGERIWDAVECFIAFGVHVVDYYSRNNLSPSLHDYFVTKLVGKIPTTICDSMVGLGRGETWSARLKVFRERPLKSLKAVKGVLDKLE